MLADALAYAVAELAPDVLVDVATLTGAMKVALGQRTGGYFANHDGLAAQVESAAVPPPARRLADAAGRRTTRRSVASKIADADNAAGGAGRDHRGAVPPALRRRRPVGAPRHRLGRRVARPTATSGPPDPPASGPACCCTWLGSEDPLDGIASMKGLTVRWSLVDAAEGVEEELAAYVAETSHARFTGMAGLRFKTWRMRAGASGSRAATSSPPTRRATEFQRTFTAGAAESPGSRIIGCAPVLIEECDIVAVAEGWDGFVRRAARLSAERGSGLRRPTPSWRPAGRRRRAAAPAPARRARRSCGRARGSRRSPRRAGPGRRPGRATGRCRRPRRRRGAAAAAPR